MAYIFPVNAYPDVRKAVGADIDAVILPDDMLSLDIYKGETERFIMRNLTQTQIDNPAYADEIKYAAVLFMSFLAAPHAARSERNGVDHAEPCQRATSHRSRRP